MHGRRRRGHTALWLTGVAAVLVIGGAAVTAGMIRLQRGEPDAPASPPAAGPARQAGQITVDLDPTSGFVASVRGTDANRQFLTARDFAPGTSGAEPGRYAGEVTAYDPGSFEPAGIEQGQVIPIAGHDARFVADYQFAALSDNNGPVRTPLIAWQDPSGVWLLVYSVEATDRESLERLATSVTLAPPQHVRTPFGIGALPSGLAVTYVRAVEDERDGRSGTVGLSTAGRQSSTAATYLAAPNGITVSVSASRRDDDWTAEKRKLDNSIRAGEYDGWFTTGRNPLSRGATGGTLIVETATCVVRLSAADRDKVTRDDLVKVVADMAIGDCGDPDTWIAPLS